MAWILANMGLVIGIITGAVHAVEAEIGYAKGTEKRAAAVQIVTDFVNGTLHLQPGTLETDVDALLGALVDGVVWLLNRKGVFQHKTSAPTPALPTDQTTPAGAPNVAANQGAKASNDLVTAGAELRDTPVGGAADSPPSGGGAASGADSASATPATAGTTKPSAG